ncbi:exopolyphosphatase PRUNE1 [Onthophagus taurus]|uniref:exopolyphosphatase PRUNE1 n=1 Tax=Onthophagus taurus TaxID=166361 RepID=UPI0039BE084C
MAKESLDPFVEYVKSLKTHLPIKPHKVCFVLGNESCDLDSTISSLSLAYFLNKTNTNQNLVLPLLNVLENEFPLRTENIYVLNKCDIKENYLIYKDTINLNELKQDKELEIILVDHHVLSKHFEFLKNNVKRIFDHRPLDPKANWDKDIIDMRTVGSCTTLIANEILKNDISALSPTVAKCLYETIIFDTIGLKEDAGKVKQLDLEISHKLESHLKIKSNPAKLFDELWSAHIDISKLSPKQLLAKDLKILNNVLIPGLPMLVKKYLNQTEVLKHIRDFCDERQCDHIILMGLDAQGTEVKRDIAFYSICQTSKLLSDIIKILKDYKDLEMKEECCDVDDIRYFRHNLKISRKQIMPKIQEVLEKLN